MKRIFMPGCLLLLSALAAFSQEPAEKAETDSFYLLTPVEVRAVRAGDNAPFSKTNISKKEISKANLGQDIPFLLNQTPAVVINSDAGNGIGYTGIRIRGTDATRINVTLNGIPYNDAESQGTFFVDLPDFSSSAGSIQVQRGLGTSSNGAGAFGATINFSTNELNKEAYAEINNSLGSFNSRKHTFKAGTGLVNGFSTDLRLSRISSDGFIDRASSKLESFYFTSAYTAAKTSVRVNVFSGKEKTYQAWYGIPESDLRAGNRTVNYAGTERPGAPYDNETDNYTQTHYQFFFNHSFSPKISYSSALFLTKGKGYYEQYKAGELYTDYGMPEPLSAGAPVNSTDLVRQLWLDNDFYGKIFSLQYKDKRTTATLGGALTRYEGLHFGKVKWAEKGLTSIRNWYDLDAGKNDFTLYLKEQTQFNPRWSFYYDLQYRYVNYRMNGFRYNPGLQVSKRFHFFNPRAGISFHDKGWKGFASLGIASKEPNRDDFEAGLSQQPRPEKLYDYELGIEQREKNIQWGATLYYMRYKDQLVLTGKINDVGAYTRSNIPESYRAGIELQGSFRISNRLNAAANLALSRNRVLDFTEYVDDYDNGGQQSTNYYSTAIAYSPAVVGGATLNFLPFENTELSLIGKYVSNQYLDNTGNPNRQLDAFYTQDIRLLYTLKRKCPKEISIIAQLMNVLDEKYEPNGYTYSYIYGGSLVTENFYFPMAGRSVLVGINIKL